MSFPQSSACTRAVNRYLSMRGDAPWIPDSAFTVVFERYCCNSKVARRNGSSVPGPMENRKRLGKRQMGELNFGQRHPMAPIWELYNTVDMSNWKWQPPTSASARIQSLQQQPNKNLWETVLGWLYPETESREDTQEAQVNEAPTSAAAQSPEILEEILDAAEVRCEDDTYVAERPMPKSIRYNKWLVKKGIEALILDVSNTTVVELSQSSFRYSYRKDSKMRTRVNFDQFCRRLQDVSDQITSESLCHIMNGIVEGMERQIQCDCDPKTIHTIKAQFCMSIIEILERHPSIAGNTPVWSTLLSYVTDLRLNSLRLFERIMACVPDKHLNSLASDIAGYVEASCLSMSAEAGKNTMRQINAMTDSLKRLSSSNHASIFDDVTRRLSGHSASYTIVDFPTLRLSWLSILARLPGVEQDFLLKTTSLLENDSMPFPLTQREVCQVFLGWLNRHYTLKNSDKLYNSVMTPAIVSTDDGWYGNLGLKMWQTGQPRHIKSLCRFLHGLGRDQDILRVLRGLRNLVQHDASPLSNLAIGLRHAELALQIHMRYIRSRQDGERFWKSAFADDTLGLLLSTKGISAQKVLKTLRIFPMKHRKRMRRPSRYGLSQRDVDRSERAAMAFAYKSGISHRNAFERISGIVKHFQNNRHPIPPRVLRALLYHITGDLRQGKPGRTTRLRWFLRLVLNQSGPGMTLEVGIALKRWREQLFPSLSRTLMLKRRSRGR